MQEGTTAAPQAAAVPPPPPPTTITTTKDKNDDDWETEEEEEEEEDYDDDDDDDDFDDDDDDDDDEYSDDDDDDDEYSDDDDTTIYKQHGLYSDDDDDDYCRGFEIIDGNGWSEYGSRFEALYCGISSLLEHGMVAEANKMLPDYLNAQYDSPGFNISWRMAAQAMAQVVKEGFSYVYKGPTPLAADEFENIMEFIKSANFYCMRDDDLEEIREIADAVKGQMKLQREQSSKPPPTPARSFGGGGSHRRRHASRSRSPSNRSSSRSELRRPRNQPKKRSRAGTTHLPKEASSRSWQTSAPCLPRPGYSGAGLRHRRRHASRSRSPSNRSSSRSELRCPRNSRRSARELEQRIFEGSFFAKLANVRLACRSRDMLRFVVDDVVIFIRKQEPSNGSDPGGGGGGGVPSPSSDKKNNKKKSKKEQEQEQEQEQEYRGAGEDFRGV